MASQNPTNNPANTFPIAFEDCRMSPIGVASVVHQLVSQPLLQNVPLQRLHAMAIAYLAYGGSEDNDHAVLNTGVHRAHHESHILDATYHWRGPMREGYRRTIMDILTWFDRLSGGGTLLLHASGTRPPSAPPTVEEQKLDVFLPLHAIRTNTGVRVATARIIQHFAEHIGFPIMQNWDRAKGLQVGGPHHNATAPRTPTNRNAGQPLMPPLTGPYVTFYGRAPGTLELLIAQEIGTGVSETIPPTQPIAAVGLNATLHTALAVSNVTLPAPPSASPTSRRGTSASSHHARIKAEALDAFQQPGMGYPTSGHGVVPHYTQDETSHSVAELEARIVELENVIKTQGEEICSLRAMLEGNVRHEPIHSLPIASAGGRTSVSSADTFGHSKGKTPARRGRTPSSPSLHSVLSVSSVSSVSPTPTLMPSPSPSTCTGTPSASRTLSRAGHVSRLSHASAAGSSQARRHDSEDEHEGGYHYGYYTDRAVRFLSATWGQGILRIVPDIDVDVAEAIGAAMRDDWGLSETE